MLDVGAVAARDGKYVYAIALGAEAPTGEVLGVDGRPVYRVSNGRVAAVVSDCARAKIRPERLHLAAHKGVLKQLMLETTVLPMAFGIIADDLPAVRHLLTANQRGFLSELKRLEGQVEMGLRVIWDVPDIFEYFIDLHPELRATRDRVFGTQHEPRQEEKIEVGQMFERLLQEDRELHAAQIEEVLSPCCVETKRNPPRNVKEVVNLNCLVGRGSQKRLEDAVLAAARLFDNNFAFDFNGPWAPHNFVEMNLQLAALNPGGAP